MTSKLEPTRDEKLTQLLQLADQEFQRIRWDWSDPRWNITAGRSLLKQALELLNATPVEINCDDDDIQ